MKLQMLSVAALCAVCAGAKEPELAIPKWGSAKPAEFRPAAKRPADFDAYWEGEAARFAREVPLRPSVKLRADITNAVADVHEVSFALTADGASRLYGWLAIPKDVPAGRRLPLCVEVPGAGYGFWTIDPSVAKDEIHLKLTVYDFCPVPYTGFARKADYEAFQRPWTNRYHATTYATSGWGASREETFFHDRWLTMSRAVDWTMATYGARIDPTRVSYTGESQGGGTGFFLLAMNRHFTHGVLRVPAVTDVLGRLAGRKSGWPYPVESQSTDAARAKALEVAPYFDGACFAPRITVPVRCCLGTADVTCPWPNVSAAFNCIACRDKELLVGLNDNHTSNGSGQRQKMEAWRKARTAHGDHAVGRLADAEAFAGLHPRFRKAFDFLLRKDLATLAAGDYVLEKAADGTPSVKAMVQEMDLKPYGETTQLVEAHRRFIDIQMPLNAPETFGFATLDDTLPTWTFDTAKDCGLQRQACRKVTLQPNEFAIFFPPYGAHAPCLSDNGPRKVRKVVVKVLAESTDAAKPLIVFNDDVDVVLRAMRHANATNRCTKEMVERYYSRIVDGGKVTHLLMNVNSRCSGYPSKVAPNYWAALDEPDMNHPAWVAAMRDLVVGQGVDIFRVGIDKCRAKGVSPWLSFRMNDCHYSFDRKYILNVGFWRDHPELWIDPSSTNRANGAWGERAFDFRKPKVQEYTLAYLREALERYDVDGIELDWLRFSAYAPRKVARTEGAAALTAFTRKAKALVAEQEKRRGHKIAIAARVASDPEMALNHSMDWRAWAKEGLVDWLIACNFWHTADFELPLARWTSELKAINPRILLLPGLDCGIQLPGQGHRNMTVDEYAGWGDKMYGEGAKGIYFFNLFCEPYERHPEKTETWELVTKKGFTPENLAKRKRTVPKNAPRECANGGWYSPIY